MPRQTAWKVDRIVHFDFSEEEQVREGHVHFGFYDREGRHYLVAHQKHYAGAISKRGELEWTVSAVKVFGSVPNITADIRFPMFVDSLPDGRVVISSFGNNLVHVIDPQRKKATVLFDGTKFEMKRAGNCVVDDEGCVWVNEVQGGRIWRLDPKGRPTLTLGKVEQGFQFGTTRFESARFGWIYDIRRGPDGAIYVLDSRNYAVRRVDISKRTVETVAGTGKAGYGGDGGDPLEATFGGDPSAKFDGPISISLDERGNAYVGDRFNRVVRMIDRKRNTIETIAGDHESASERPNDPKQREPLALRLPKISSMEYHEGRLLVPTDLAGEMGDLVVLRNSA